MNKIRQISTNIVARSALDAELAFDSLEKCSTLNPKSYVSSTMVDVSDIQCHK